MPKIVHKNILLNADKSNQTLVGIDAALTKTGLCVLEGSSADIYLIDTRKLRGAERLYFIGDTIRSLLRAASPISMGAVEGGAYGAGGHLYQLGQVQGISQIALYEEGADIVEVEPTRLKKFFAGHGNASKEKMANAAEEVLETTEGLDDNMIDSFALAYLLRTYLLEDPQTRKQAEVILDLEVERFSDGG